jgi:hypothetical protein
MAALKLTESLAAEKFLPGNRFPGTGINIPGIVKLLQRPVVPAHL